ncbi:MAG: epoxyqueuosine reductase [Thermodesulfobacteriota bacterium]
MNTPVFPDDLRHILEETVKTYSQKNDLHRFWRTPLLATAVADDRFDVLPRIAAEDHVLPRDLLDTARSVVVFFVPFSKELANENHPGDNPSRSWGLAYEATNRLIGHLSEVLQQELVNRGDRVALTPATHNFDPEKLMARWSHKHLGYLAGLGRFGVNAQFITPAGCAGRMGSLVTDAELGDSPLVNAEELCLHKNGRKCLICVERCPVGAVSVSGIDRKRCWERLKENIAHLDALSGLDSSTHVCGKCQVMVPCSLKDPTGNSGRRS